MKDISKTQKRIYEYLLERSQDGVPPSVREIGAAVGLSSTSSVQANLDALEQAGYIQRDPLKKRTIRILGREDNVVTNVPIVGTVTAGAPILAFEQIEGSVAEKTPVARNGEIVVAMIEDEATVKTFYKENGHFRLQPENDTYEPIIVNEVSILGKVVAVIRYY